MKKGAGRRRLAFYFLVSGCSVRRSATRNGGGPPFRTVDTAIRPRIPISDRALNRDLPLRACRGRQTSPGPADGSRQSGALPPPSGAQLEP